MQLRPYQKESIDAVYAHLCGHDDNPCIVIPTAGGKTPVMATICKEAVGRWNGRVLILAHVKELLEQTVARLQDVAPDMWMKIGVYSAGLKSRDTEHPIIVAGIQSVYKRACDLGPFDLVIVDECFPAGTPIATPRGEVPIEDLYVGQPVNTALGVGEVECISARNVNELIKVDLSNGARITCTPNHPFFTESGWVAAGKLEEGSRLFGREDVQMLREALSPLGEASERRDGSELHERASLGEAEVLLKVLFQDGGEPYVRPCREGKGEPYAQEAEDRSDCQGRQRESNGTTESTAAGARPGLAQRVRGCYGDSSDRGGAHGIQDRHCQSRPEDSCGGGREFPQAHQESPCRQSTDCLPAAPRVARVTHFKREGPASVFNLQVKGHPSYYAHGVLVHNCHMIPPDGDGMYRSLLADMQVINPLVRVIGLTATPFRMKSGMICAPENFLNSICYEVGVKELIRDGYLCKLVTKSGRQKADTSGLHVRAGEFIASEAEALMDQDELVAAACAEIVEYTRDRKSCLVFASGVKHGHHLAESLRARTRADVGEVYGNTLSFERDRTLEEFRAGKLKYLVNVNVLTTGFDAPNIDCVALVRPTLSPGLYYQMVGRGFRLHPDKEDCLVLDFGGNVLRHGPVDQIKVQPVQEGNDEAPAKECPQCYSVIAAGYATCPDCGYEFPPPERQKHDAKATTAGILSGQEAITEYPVQDVFYSVHTKRGAPPDHPKTMRVEYQINLRHYVSEWVCPEHNGYARKKFESWWRQRCDAQPPNTAEDAVALAEEGALAPTIEIKVRSVVGEKFDQVVGHVLGETPRLPGWDEELVNNEPVGAFADLSDEDVPF